MGKIWQNGWLLRPACLDDVLPMAALDAQNFPSPWNAQLFRDCVLAGYTTEVAEDPHHSLRGYGVLSCGANEAHLLNLSVCPSVHGLGIGRWLLEHMLEKARQKHAQCVFLEVRQSASIAQKLYESTGFVVIGERKNYYTDPNGTEDAWVMQRLL